MGESLWQKDRMVTHILFDLCLFKHFSPVANFGNQSLFQLIQNPRKFKGINAQPSEKAGNSLQFHPQNVSKFMNSQCNFPLWKNCSGL